MINPPHPLPTFKFQIICRPSFIGNEFYSIHIIQDDEKYLLRNIRISDLKNKSFNDFIWEAMRKEFDKLMEEN